MSWLEVRSSNGAPVDPPLWRAEDRVLVHVVLPHLHLTVNLAEVVTGSKKVVWKNLLDKLGDYFDRRFGAGWKEKDDFFKKFEEELSETKKESS